MDAVDAERFARITRVPNGYERVLAGIRAAQRAGLSPVKINCVLMRGFNDDQITAFGRFAREEGVAVRFIEFMPLEEDRVWSPEIVVTLDEILRRMAEFMPLREIEHARSETARRYVFEDGIGEIGIIAPVSHPVLRTLQPGARHLRRQDPHLPVLGARARSGRTDGERRQRRRDGRFHSRCGGPQGRAPPHRRTGLHSGIADHGAYRGIAEKAVSLQPSAFSQVRPGRKPPQSTRCAVSWIILHRGRFAQSRSKCVAPEGAAI